MHGIQNRFTPGWTYSLRIKMQSEHSQTSVPSSASACTAANAAQRAAGSVQVASSCCPLRNLDGVHTSSSGPAQTQTTAGTGGVNRWIRAFSFLYLSKFLAFFKKRKFTGLMF